MIAHLRADRIYTTWIKCTGELCMGVIWSVIGILICGGLGGLGAWALVTALDLSGTFSAIVAAVIGMVFAVALWAGVTSMLRSTGLIR